MLFRFAAALCLIVLIALAGTRLEQRNLQLKRAISQQQYQRDALLDSFARLRLESQRVGAPARLMESLKMSEISLQRPDKSQRIDERRTPLTNWTTQSVTEDKK